MRIGLHPIIGLISGIDDLLTSAAGSAILFSMQLNIAYQK